MRAFLILLALLALLATAGCVAPTMTKTDNGGVALALVPVATLDDLDAAVQHSTDEIAAVRKETGDANAKLREEMAAADQKVRADVNASLDAGRAAYEKAIADGLTPVQAEMEKFRATVLAAGTLAAEASTKATAANDAAIAGQKKADDAFAKRDEEFREMLQQVREGRLSLQDFLLMLGIGGVTATGGAVGVNKWRNRKHPLGGPAPKPTGAVA